MTYNTNHWDRRLADRASSRRLLRLENLDTDLQPAESAIAATRNALIQDSANSYLPFFGIRQLRESVVAHVAAMSGVHYDSELECLICAGGLNGILLSLLAFVNPGDAVLTPDLGYIGFLNRIKLAGAGPKLLPMIETGLGWTLDQEELVAPTRATAILMMSPSMPSGAVVSRQEWESIAELCRRNDAILIYDAAMERILYDNVEYIHPASIADLRSRTLTVGSVSKECRMIGWRVGWVVGPQHLISPVKKVAISDVVTPVGIAQRGAAVGLVESLVDLPRCVAEWQTRRDLLCTELAGLPVVKPRGGWSLLLNVRRLGFGAIDASKLLFEKGEIAATPMDGWGSSRSSDHVRLVFSKESCSRLQGIRERVRVSLGV